MNEEVEEVKLDTEDEALKLNAEAAMSESESLRNDKNIMHQAYVKITPNPEVENAICEGSASMY